MIPNKIKSILSQRIPASLIKERENGKTKLSYISGSTVVGILNQAFGLDWDWIPEREWIEASQNKFKADNNYYKAPDDRAVIHNGKRGEWNIEPPIAHVRGTLIVRYLNEKGEYAQVVKGGHGSKALIGGASEQDSIFKSASTDALKRAAMLLGIGLQLYRDKEEEAYFEKIAFEDTWTPELREQFKEDFDYIDGFSKRFAQPTDALNKCINVYSQGAAQSYSYLTPQTIHGFVEYCKKEIH